MQKTLKIQSFQGGFLVYTNVNGKTEKSIKVTVEELADFTTKFFTEPPKEPEKEGK